MAFNVFLQLDGVTGESTDDGHKGWIEINDYGFGINSGVSVGSGTGGSAAGRSAPSFFGIGKVTDSASVALASAAAGDANTFAKMCVQVCAIAKDGTQYVMVQYNFTNVQVASIQWNASAGAGERPTETVSFVFETVTWTYTPLKADNTAGSKIGPKGWNYSTNKAM